MPGPLSVELQEQIKEHLTAGWTNWTHLAKHLNIARITLRKYAYQLGFGTPEDRILQMKKHSLNREHFHTIDTPNKAYVLGFIYADGCNTGLGLTISIQESDEPVLDFIKSELGASEKLRFIPAKKEGYKNQLALNIKSVHLSRSLTNVGCPKAKSRIIDFPDWIGDTLMPHFIRGLFDGDGSIRLEKGTKSGWHSSFASGSFKFLVALEAYLYRHSIIGKIYGSKHNKGYNLSIGKMESIAALLRHMYEQPGFGMERKKILSDQFFQYYKSYKPRLRAFQPAEL